jgi:biotin transport system substrate-specific component
MTTWISDWRAKWLAASAPSLTARRLLAGAGLTLATAVGAWLVVPVPGSPVPITLQTFVVLAGAGLLGGRLSTSSQLAYLVLGGIGLPWFAAGAWGAPVFFGATGGYLVGFVLASWAVGRMLSASRPGTGRVLAALALGEVLILACGVTWLAAALKVSWLQACALGALPFLPGDLAKLGAAAALVRAGRARAERSLS